MIKNFYVIMAAAVCIFCICCKKSDVSVIEPGSIDGRWTHTAHYYSIGGPGQWLPDSKHDYWIELKSDGSFHSNLQPFSSATSYQVIDSIHLKLIVQPGSDSLLYIYSLHEGNLDLSQYAPVICIEGCADRFTR